jgi:type II secretory pathway component PulK
MKPTTPQAKTGKRRAVVLLAVLVVVTILALAAYQYSDLMTTEYKAADNTVRATQATAFAQSGVQYVAALLSNPDNLTNILQNNPYDNPTAFQDVIIQPNDVPAFQGRFSIVAPPYFNNSSTGATVGNTPFYFGVLDESSKLNLSSLLQQDASGNTAYNALMMLPNMTPNLADAIVDWIDANNTPRTSGAEDETYMAQSPSYQAKDGPLDSIEELLLVEGMTPQILFGTDVNRNGMLDPGEDNGSGMLDPGLASYLTLYTREFNWDSSGNPRLYVNGNGLQQLFTNMQGVVGQDMATFIILYRQYGPVATSSGPSKTGSAGTTAPAGSGVTEDAAEAGRTTPTTGGAAKTTGAAGSTSKSGTTTPTAASSTPKQGSLGGVQLNFKTKATNQISSLYDLIGAKVQVPGQKATDPPTQYASPLNSSTLQSLLPTVLDELTTKQQQILPGRVNINTANETVLTAVPNLSVSQVQAIIAGRPPDPSGLATAGTTYNTPAWLMIQAGFTAAQMKQLEPYITARTQVYRVQVLGYFDDGPPTFARVEAVIDTNGGRPRVLYQRDISELGKGFDLTQGQ